MYEEEKDGSLGGAAERAGPNKNRGGKTVGKILLILTALVIVGASFFGGVYYGYEHRPAIEKVLKVANQTPPPNYQDVDFNLFWEVWSRIEEKFVDKGKIDRQSLVFGAVTGLVNALGDPYTEFLPPKETQQFQEDIKGSFGGIGAEIGMRKGFLTVIAPLKESPAEKAGIRAGDKILKVDDTETAELNLNEAVRLIRGPEGTEVRLLIFRDEEGGAPREVTVIRGVINVPIIKTQKLDNGIFVISLHHFTENAGIEFRKAVQEFYSSDSKKLVFDMRNNPGGFLVIAVDIASWWLPAGDVVAREQYADGTEDIYRSRGYGLLSGVPTVVLVNEGSASASEIVAGALRDLKGIKLIGRKSFGKGSVQELQDLERGSSLKITIAKWLTPNGIEINNKGLEPDIMVEFPKEEDLKEGDELKDWDLEKAIEVLNGM